jgi:uncharacterized membrane protein
MQVLGVLVRTRNDAVSEIGFQYAEEILQVSRQHGHVFIDIAADMATKENVLRIVDGIGNPTGPFVKLIVFYCHGNANSLTFAGNKSFVSSIKESNWAVYVMGAAAACIEVGFLLAYRSGWRLSIAAVATNVAVTVMLVPIGIIIFKDHLSARNVLGLVFCVLGLVLVVRD